MRHFLKYCILLFSVNLFAQSDQIDSLILLKKNNQLQIQNLTDQIKQIDKQIGDLERIKSPDEVVDSNFIITDLWATIGITYGVVKELPHYSSTTIGKVPAKSRIKLISFTKDYWEFDFNGSKGYIKNYW